VITAGSIEGGEFLEHLKSIRTDLAPWNYLRELIYVSKIREFVGNA
jgi:hypothetical protein